MMNARTGVAQAYQVNRSLFPMIRWLSVPRGEDANYFIQCDRKLNVLGPHGEEVKDRIDLWTACAPVAITTLSKQDNEETSSKHQEEDDERCLQNTFTGANRLMSDGRPKYINSSFIKQFLLRELSRNVPFHVTVADFNFLIHLQQNHKRYGLQSWEITRLGEHIFER